MTYPICPRCGKGRMVPMLMSGPACDLACERPQSKPAEGYFVEKHLSGISYSALAHHMQQHAQLFAPVVPIQQFEVSCHTLFGTPMLYARDRSRGIDFNQVVKLGGDYNLKFDDGSQQIVYVAWVNRIAIKLQTSTTLMSQWIDGEPAVLEVP